MTDQRKWLRRRFRGCVGCDCLHHNLRIDTHLHVAGQEPDRIPVTRRIGDPQPAIVQQVASGQGVGKQGVIHGSPIAAGSVHGDRAPNAGRPARGRVPVVHQGSGIVVADRFGDSGAVIFRDSPRSGPGRCPARCRPRR